MAKQRQILTFVALDEPHLRFVRSLQRLMQKKSGKKRQPPLHGVIRGIIFDYQRMLEEGSGPDFYASYDRAKAGKSAPKGVFAGEPFVVESI